jgi:ribulose-phosphate 3-epimerase
MKIAPSILSADFSKLKSEIRSVAAVSDMIHIDVMDGHFVPNISIGVPVVESLAKMVTLPLDVHLMIESPEKYVVAFADALASGVGLKKFNRDISQDFITVHAEACGGSGALGGAAGSVEALSEVLKMIKARGIKAGFSVKPATPIEQYESVLPLVDMVLIMTVEPGFGGQKFMDYMMAKVKWLKGKLDEHAAGTAANAGAGLAQGSSAVPGRAVFEIEVDGGINAETAKIAKESGANVLVAGNYIFKSRSRKSKIEALK